MAPTILVVGATGNTGRKVVETLPQLIKQSSSLSNHRILCLTRSASSDAAKKLAQIPAVEIVEQNWVEIDDAWLKEHNVERVFVASHNEPQQFAEEGQFYVNCLHAGVKYAVRISTTHPNVRPDFKAYYPRTHWAIEQMLSQPEFKDLAWTSLHPQGFIPMFLGSTVEFIKNFRKTGKQGTLSTMIDADVPYALVDSGEVGIVAGHLLAQEDVASHNNKKYIVNGPEDFSGNKLVKLVEEHIGTKVEEDKVVFKDMSFIEEMAKGPHSKNVILSIKHAGDAREDVTCRAAATSKEILELYAPRRTTAEVLEELLSE
ncbi:NAD(P)-binding protein [Aureobasidium namibiae CBS 147.97]|uniref:NAD(P)-binding protein n=1 Tax=Aureobasidium namibiae CBS 147.97 TaxID=1043004 RepID=A0A074X030_9PEZI